jgi:glycosyltransferase involved in cell wall biosynthesis
MQMDLKNDNIKSCLVVTYGPVPTPQYQTIEGGGMRAWGLAKGLTANSIQATVAVNNSFPQELAEHDGIRLVNWGVDEAFAELINSFDAVIISYCMGDASIFVADRIADNVKLILDAYVPIYVEVSARQAKDMDSEFTNYMADLGRFNHALKRGDYFLCASTTQKIFYTGVLSALGIVNPRSYRQDRILIVPFGIHETKPVITENPYAKLGITKDDFVVLWFGGLYPWFRVEELLGAIEDLSGVPKLKFVFVGGKNPFNPNPDFARQYEKTVAFAKEKKFIDKLVYFVDWVDYETRVNWYKGADVVISLNQPGEENGLSWRTRVMDFVWGELAMITNGGDPLSEALLEHDSAIRLPSLSANALSDSIKQVYEKPAILKKVQERMIQQKQRYQWPGLLKPVVAVINEDFYPHVDEVAFRDRLGLTDTTTGQPQENLQPQGRSRRYVGLARKSIGYAKRKGLRRSAKVAVTIARNAAKSKVRTSGKQYVFISHPINHTGAPLVLLDIVQEYAEKYGAKRIRLVAPGITTEQARDLKKRGIKIDKAALGIGFRVIALQLGLHKNDFVLMNTAAIYDNYRNFMFHALESGKINHAHWFIHEDIEQLPVVAQELVLNTNLRARIDKLINQEKLSVIVPSKRVQADYNEFFDTKLVKVVDLRVEVDDKYVLPHPVSDYDTIRFLLSGTAGDGRKGQLIAISAFYSFLKNFYEKAPEKYRRFQLHLVAIGDEYISQQIKTIGRSLLGDSLIIYPILPKNEALDISAKCNAVICCSLNETFGLYVAECMAMGHFVLRNDSAGIDEQLKEGVNGLRIDSNDVEEFAAALEKVLNKSTYSNEQLQQMGEASQEIARIFSTNSYLEQIGD